MISPPERKPGCPANADLEAHSAGELPELDPHVAGCTSCGPYVAALKEETAAFVKARPPELFLKKLEARRAAAPRARPWWQWLAVVVPVAAALLLVVWSRPVDDGVVLKGGEFRVFAKRGDAEPSALINDALAREGDLLRFSYDAPADGFIAVLDLDGSDTASVFYPWQGTAPAAIARGASVLPGSVALDAQVGPEWLVAVWSKKPFDVKALLAQLKGQATRDRIALTCDGCQVSTLRVVKQK